MRRLGTAITLGLLLAGTSAYAQEPTPEPTPGVSALKYYVATTSELPPALFQQFSDSGGAGDALTDASGSSFSGGSGTAYGAYVQENLDGTITFENSTIAAGGSPFAYTTATSTVGFSFFDGDDVTFESVITAAGLGFYLADLAGCVDLESCAKIGDGLGFPGLSNLTSGSSQVGFNFAIQDTIGDGTAVDLFRVSGIVSLNNGVLSGNFTNEEALIGFGAAYDPQPQAFGFHWQETPVIRTLKGGVVHNLTYTTSVFSDIAQRQTVASPCSAGLIGYAGFGDPIGRGGGAALFSGLVTDVGALVGSLVGGAPCAVDDDAGRPGIGFTPITFQKPVFKDGVLTFGPAAIPEPATWAMLIMGFGGIGATLRRRRALGAHA